MLGQQRQDRRGRVPDADPPLGQELAEPAGVLAQRLADQDQGRRVAAGGEQVEDRQVEMQGRVRGESVVVRPGPECVRAPVEEREGVGVREHHALGLAGRARGVEDVGEVVSASGGARARGRRRPGLGPGASPGAIGRAGVASPVTIRRGRGLRRATPGGGPAPGSAATTTALTPASARIPAARAAGPVGSTGT